MKISGLLDGVGMNRAGRETSEEEEGGGGGGAWIYTEFERKAVEGEGVCVCVVRVEV